MNPTLRLYAIKALNVVLDRAVRLIRWFSEK